jgi:hypothetical protein
VTRDLEYPAGMELARVPPGELERLRDVGRQVSEVLRDTGIPVDYQPDPRGAPSGDAGVHIQLDDLTPGGVVVNWACDAALVSRSIAASRQGDYTNVDVRLNVKAAFAMGEAIVKILTEAGYEAGMGVDMDPGAVWVRARG